MEFVNRDNIGYRYRVSLSFFKLFILFSYLPQDPSFHSKLLLNVCCLSYTCFINS